jgi:methyl-accepting chemotaxis protein
MKFNLRAKVLGSSGPSILFLAGVGLFAISQLASVRGQVDAAQSQGSAQALIDSTCQTATIEIFALATLGIILAVAVSQLIARGMTRTAKAVLGQEATIQAAVDVFTSCLEGFAENDLTREFTSHVALIEGSGSDEIGQIGTDLNSMLAALKKMSAAYETSRSNLAKTIGEVRSAAETVSRTSQELSSASTQTGSATQQIANTVTQVANGASDQARVASETSASTQELTALIEHVRADAGETNKRVAQAAVAVEDVTSAVDRADRVKNEAATFTERVHVALGHGIESVGETAAGMRRIKAAVETPAEQIGRAHV